VPSIAYTECSECGDILLSPVESRKIIKFVREYEQSLVDKLPVKEFISPAEAYSLLNITKQAFSKNPKIKRGMIYNTLIGGKRVFHKKSVELFKKTGNGKFLLPLESFYEERPTKTVLVYKVNEPESRKISYREADMEQVAVGFNFSADTLPSQREFRH